ncbi:BREX-2 system adenine-specific DNA-methyltransferase PglX [Solwaraspora sp. WMMA2080]|uniref:BREX-2 system adenine-specific DNA-methyltransferase PglX n=1 Tax=Solwaraspora sp. WMMA2080 TaxID=3015165 RepID=UPI00248ACCF9|nr:BREX-2 system adenine-specific DNA-methyltransferase PglX [Solwaraspora sp. WMMA2080]WBC18664.1 BREX-2 system adenine-specific DNA-methyltransferase PglX [Solwaraspora sp. WMMA2080]
MLDELDEDARRRLQQAMQAQVKHLVDDLRMRLAEPESLSLRAELLQEYEKAKKAERLAGAFEVWLEDVLDQAAVAWVLGCVFVRFCEDNELIDGLWIGGDDPAAPAETGMQRRQAYLIEADHSLHNDRHWLREAFRYLGRLRPTAQIFDKHNPVWRFDISGAAAEELSNFFRTGEGRVSLRSATLDTRFLGDLYQELSTHAKKTYALLQTPVFVEKFILDRTFEPALSEFGLPEMKVIDPTCGSGHFLLGAFDRLVREWRKREPTTDLRAIVDRALGQVTGVDINAFAVAIARFRLLVAAIKLGKWHKLERCPAFPVRVATGDSLLEWGRFTSRAQGDLLAALEGEQVFAYESEDDELLAEYLEVGQYTVVVGNPPYITVADPARNKLYRSIYPRVCHRQYALTVPFAKRFFDLAKKSDEYGEGAGFVGQITGNAFMKREFGKKLIEDYFAHEVELSEVIDTSGAYIPGHGTPTVILVGRNNDRRRLPVVRAVLGVQGEPTTPDNPADGHVWQAIVNQVEAPGSESRWISVTNLARRQFSYHPWSLAGGGASGLLVSLNSSESPLKEAVQEIGFGAVTREDSAYMVGTGMLRRRGVYAAHRRALVEGEATRDWAIEAPVESIWPYSIESLKAECDEATMRLLWPTKPILVERSAYGSTQLERGLEWFEYSMFFTKRYRIPLSIAFAFVATHNHFVLDRGGRVFNRSAPVIKLPEGATEDDHLRLLGVLNSSTACFWLKQVSHNKGSQGVNEGFKSQEWERFFEFTGTKLQELPLPAEYSLGRARELDTLAQRLGELTPAAVAQSGVPTVERLAQARAEYDLVRARMIALQEELDWEVYRLYGLMDEDLTHPDPPGLSLGERAFEITMVQQKVKTAWFVRHDSVPVDKPNPDWPADYRDLVERRISATAGNRHLQLIERPECKRRWATEGWDKMQAAALRDWLLERLEAPELWGGMPEPLSVAQLADRVAGDADFQQVLALLPEYEGMSLVVALDKLVATEHVPFLPKQRYKPSGLRKRVLWEQTWEKQRREDAGETVEIDVPPKYTSADFVRPSYAKARGKLDVPKERFISYPEMGRDTDSSLLLGWAGWDHLAQAQALATVYVNRRSQEAWEAHRLLPLLAGLLELEPWLHQWYAAERPGYPGSPAQFYTDFIDTELSTLSSDRTALSLLRGLPE